MSFKSLCLMSQVLVHVGSFVTVRRAEQCGFSSSRFNEMLISLMSKAQGPNYSIASLMSLLLPGRRWSLCCISLSLKVDLPLCLRLSDTWEESTLDTRVLV